MGKPFLRKVNAVLLAALLVAAVILWLVWAQTERQVRSIGRAARARGILTALHALATDLDEARARRCAFVRRADAAQRSAFLSAAGRTRADLAALLALYRTEDTERPWLTEVNGAVGRELDVLERSLGLRERNRFDDRGQLGLSQEAQAVADRRRQALSSLEDREDQALAAESRTARKSAELAETVVGVGLLLMGLCITVSGVAAARQLGAVDRRGREAERRAEEQAARLSEAQGALAELASLRGQLEEHLRQAQGLASVGRVTSGVAHDFNNLLTLILGCSEASLRALPENDPSRPFISEVVQAGRRAAALTRQLMRTGRGGEPARLDLGKAVADAEPLLRRLAGRGVEVRTVLAPGLGAVWAVPAQVDQVLLNLVANARDAMPEGGTLTLETRAESGGTDGKPGYVLLAVTDTGCGMDGETRARLFEPFFTTKGQGTGLGMAIVHDAVQQSGGRVEVDSEPGRGTTIRVYFPLAPG